MAFDWKKKFEEGKQKAADAFANAVVKGEELLEKGEKAAAEFGQEVKAKVEEIKKKDGGPKNG
ncbi:MAG: hypothetical protein Q8K65_04900 [Alphaproteobacteria bacterium]|nr:hypothetical protein [Alphaproteobacteria bacterium]